MYYGGMSKRNTSKNWRSPHEKQAHLHSYRIPVNDAEHDAIVRICNLLDIRISETFLEWLTGTRIKNVAKRLVAYELRRLVGLMRNYGSFLKIPELENMTVELIPIIDTISREIIPTKYSGTSVPVRDTIYRRNMTIIACLDDDDHQAAISMKKVIGVPATHAFRKFIIEKLIPTTEPTLMQREVLEIMINEFTTILASYNPKAREQYIDTVVAYAKNIINYARQL